MTTPAPASNPAAAALDLGGVLLTDGTQTAFNKIEALSGLPPGSIARTWHNQCRQPAELGHMTSAQVCERLAPKTGIDPAAVEETILGEFQPIPAGISLLAALHQNRCRVVLATNHLNEWIARWDQTHEWWPMIDSVVCSAAIGRRKPDPAFYTAVAEATNGSKGAWFIDDTPQNIAAANTAGFCGILASPQTLAALADRAGASRALRTLDAEANAAHPG